MDRSRPQADDKKSAGSKKPAGSSAANSVRVRLDQESKTILERAAALRHITVSDYVRTVTVTQARKEVQAASEQTLVLTPEEQLAFWEALNDTPILTPAQEKLGTLMRGEG